MRRPPALLCPLYFASRRSVRRAVRVELANNSIPAVFATCVNIMRNSHASHPQLFSHHRGGPEEGGPVGPANAAADYVKQQSSQHAVIFGCSPIPHSLSSRSSSGVYYCLKDANRFQEVSACRKVRVIVVTESRFPGPPPRDRMGEMAVCCDAVD